MGERIQMIPAPLPDNEEERQRWLDELNILDTIEEQAYDDLTFLAAQICQTPIALVSLIDRERQWFKSHHGLDARETPRDLAFCAHAIHDDQLFLVPDSLKDERFHDNPLVTGAPHVQFYAGAPLILRDNIRVGTLCVIDDHARDMTEAQKQALAAIARQVVSQMELRLKLHEIAQLDQAKDEFISMVSHELRTPLTSINGSLALLHSGAVGGLSAQGQGLVDIALRNGERLLNIVNDILDLAKIEAGKLQLHIEPIDLEALLKNAIELNQPFCAKCKCVAKLRRSDDGQAVQIMGDEQRLLQVMSNLISNAAKFSYPNDTVLVTLGREGGEVTVGVTDHGPGIPPDKQQDLFTKFKQIHAEQNKKLPGTGLGLTICKLIVEMHQGRIGFKSEPGVQTTFYFTLPLQAAA
ncbi:MAG: GAF domain-containing sensor histidine kinase [Hydrogenophilaceae bacterium]|nr:GAF domain-containing sensor histidine kinase [Hydrogenophilaceae bacterium]